MRHQNRLLITLLLILTALFTASCSSQTSSPHVSSVESKPSFPLPPESSLSISSNGVIDLPPELVAQTKVPAKALVKLKLEDHIVATSGNPPRSHQHGTMTLSIATPDGSRKFVDVQTELDGDFDGNPTELAFRELGILLSGGSQAPTTQPSTQRGRNPTE